MIINEIPNITIQLRKTFDVGGLYEVMFLDGTKAKLNLSQINRYLDKYDASKPYIREAMQKQAIQSLDDFLEVIA